MSDLASSGNRRPRQRAVADVESRAQVFLWTQRLVLRRLTPEDADNLVALDSDPAVMRYLGNGQPTSRIVIERGTVPRMLSCYERFGGLGYWAAESKPDGHFLGWFELRPHDGGPRGEVELGYRLRSAVWGRGYATEGARAVIDKGFREFGVRRVFATTMAVNAPSRRVLEKCGLRWVRTLHEDSPSPVAGAEYGDVEYELLRKDWHRWHRPYPQHRKR